MVDWSRANDLIRMCDVLQRGGKDRGGIVGRGGGGSLDGMQERRWTRSDGGGGKKSEETGFGSGYTGVIPVLRNFDTSNGTHSLSDSLGGKPANKAP